MGFDRTRTDLYATGNTMSVNAAHGKLRRACSDLVVRWQGTRTAWHDEVSEKFEENHLKPLVAKLRRAEAALEQMDVVLHQVRRDCE
jgi:hypothetical protein